jgi:hypothetical protein
MKTTTLLGLTLLLAACGPQVELDDAGDDDTATATGATSGGPDDRPPNTSVGTTGTPREPSTTTAPAMTTVGTTPIPPGDTATTIDDTFGECGGQEHFEVPQSTIADWLDETGAIPDRFCAQACLSAGFEQFARWLWCDVEGVVLPDDPTDTDGPPGATGTDTGAPPSATDGTDGGGPSDPIVTLVCNWEDFC